MLTPITAYFATRRKPAFVFTIDTRNTKTGSSDSFSYKLPLNNSFGIYNFKCLWGDGDEQTVTGTGWLNIQHTYANEGIYTIRLEGQFQGIAQYETESNKLINISEFGGTGFRGTGQGLFKYNNFLDLVNLTDTPIIQDIFPTGIPLGQMFRFCANLEKINLIENWNMQQVREVEFFLSGCPKYIGMCPIIPYSNTKIFSYRFMFWNSTLFNDNCVNKLPIKTTITNVVDMFSGTSFSAENYSRFVIYWANMVHSQGGLPANLNFTNGSTIRYNAVNYGGTPFNNAPDAIAYLQSCGWTVTNGGIT